MMTISFARSLSLSLALLASLALAGGCTDDAEKFSSTACSANPYACDCEDIEVGVNDGRRTCVGTPLCDTTDECPPPIEAGYAAICADQGDLMMKGFSGRCRIECTPACPASMECRGDWCWFADES
jgi:hypothetical protein